MKHGWEINNFEICIEKVLYTKKIKRKDFLENGKYPIVSQEQELTNGFWNNSDDLFKIEKPVVIFGDHTQVLKYVDFDFVLGADGVKILQPKNKIEPKYFYYYLQNIDLENLGYARHYRLLKEINVTYPESIPEQKRIVNILDKAFAAIDQAKSNAEKNLQNSRELFESYLNKVFANPGEDWEEKKLGEVCEVKDGTHDSPKYVKNEGSVPFITQKNILNSGLSFEKINYISKANHDNFYRRSNVAYNDIIISMIGANRGMACIVDDKRLFSIKNVGLIKANNSYIPEFMLFYLKSNLAKQYVLQSSKGSAQGFIGLGKLRKFPILLPNLSKQKKVVDEVKGLLLGTKKLETIYQQKLADLEELKKSILQKAFDGEL